MLHDFNMYCHQLIIQQQLKGPQGLLRVHPEKLPTHAGLETPHWWGPIGAPILER